MEENNMSNNAISASDPNVLEKLNDKLQECIALQDHMKEVNAYFRKMGTCVGAPGISDEQAKKIDEQIANPRYPWDGQPFSSYDLTNNNSEIRRLKKRIEQIAYHKEVGFSGWEFEGGHADANVDMNRLQLFFDEKPNDSQRAQLKSNGFKWAPSQGAWQRQLNDNAIYAAGRMDFIKPIDGRTVREVQPKPPVKDGGAR
jgi:hypothetical protein